METVAQCEPGRSITSLAIPVQHWYILNIIEGDSWPFLVGLTEANPFPHFSKGRAFAPEAAAIGCLPNRGRGWGDSSAGSYLAIRVFQPETGWPSIRSPCQAKR